MKLKPTRTIGLLAASAVLAQEPPKLSNPQILTNREVLLTLTAPANQNVRVETSANLETWTGLTTLRTSSNTRYTDSSPPASHGRFYRASILADSTEMTGDHLATSNGEITFRPFNHASFVMVWNGKAIYSDPDGGAARFQGLPRADLILVTHHHGDHLDAPTINGVMKTNSIILAPQVVFNALPANLKAITTVLANDVKTNLLDLEVEAVPAYNLTTSNHPKGVGNGYVVTIGGKRIYISGDTEDIPELRALPNIDVAFVCMNVPFTMPVEKAADAVLEMRPKVVYPYHYSNSDVNRFKRLVATDPAIEVRLRQWY